ncbi:conserved hypothetical protein [Ricinus communis]|uniref:Uncharacterized protein n=1 Tax=Ricinus communis TaxID=3988 RepID=B9S4X2_RICCO|nr:conserved hypothetical protein [Ricinus communis]
MAVGSSNQIPNTAIGVIFWCKWLSERVLLLLNELGHLSVNLEAMQAIDTNNEIEENTMATAVEEVTKMRKKVAGIEVNA